MARVRNLRDRGQQTRGKRRALLAQLSGPLRAFTRTEAGSAGALLVSAVAALIWANSPWSGSYEAPWETRAAVRVGGAGLDMDLRHWVNDGLMVLFFFVIGLEVRREFSMGGLTDRRRAVLPAVAGLGGMTVPAALYPAVNPSGGLWLSTVESGLHASIAGMAAGLLVAAHPPRRQEVEGAASLFRAFRQSPMPAVGASAKAGLARAISVNERLQTTLHPWTGFVVVPVFALANAGIDLRGGVLSGALASPVAWGVVLGLSAGKLAGIGAGALGGLRLGPGRAGCRRVWARGRSWAARPCRASGSPSRC